jgi:hypothetical protein
MLNVANSFTAGPQTISPAAVGDRGLVLAMPASNTDNAIRITYNGNVAFTLNQRANLSQFSLTSRDLGNNVEGCQSLIGRNSSAGAVGPAAGTVGLIPASISSRYVWCDDAGNIRVHTSAPTGNTGSPTVSDTAGTVVGTQTSWHGAKKNIVPHEDVKDLLDAVLGTELYDYQMEDDGQLRSDDSPQTYTGLVIWDKDKNENAWFANNLGRQQTPVLNERNLFGYLIGAIQAQSKQIEELQRRLEEFQQNG